jgi:hypothetical protein
MSLSIESMRESLYGVGNVERIAKFNRLLEIEGNAAVIGR